MIPGTPITLLDGKEYIVPRLTRKQAAYFAEHVKFVIETPVLAASKEALDAILEVCAAALGRNYPAMGIDDVDPLLDLSNQMAVFIAAITTGPVTPAPETAPTFMMPPTGTLPN